MRGVWLLSVRRVLHDRTRTLILTLCLAFPVFLPVTTTLLIDRYEADLGRRAAESPLLAGAKGSRFDLVFAALYFRASDVPPIPWSELEVLQAEGAGVAIPLHARFTARGHPVVGTTPEYYDHRGLVPAEGSLPLVLGDCTLGASVARELGLGPGDALFSDPRDLYDIAAPPALAMTVVGVLAPRGTPDDRAVFCDVKTGWVLEGILHGHGEVEELDEDLRLGEGEGHVAFSGALIEHNEVTEETVGTFHHHEDPERLPLTAILFLPEDDRSATLQKARVNASAGWQMVAPSGVVEELLGFVFRIKGLLDLFSLFLALSTAAMTALVILLSVRIRAAEMRTLDRIGSSRSFVRRLLLTEIALVVGASLVLALGGSALALAWLPDAASLAG